MDDAENAVHDPCHESFPVGARRRDSLFGWQPRALCGARAGAAALVAAALRSRLRVVTVGGPNRPASDSVLYVRTVVRMLFASRQRPGRAGRRGSVRLRALGAWFQGCVDGLGDLRDHFSEAHLGFEPELLVTTGGFTGSEPSVIGCD